MVLRRCSDGGPGMVFSNGKWLKLGHGQVTEQNLPRDAVGSRGSSLIWRMWLDLDRDHR